MSRLDALFRTASLFIMGMNPALPELYWATAVQVTHGVYIDDALLLVWMLVLLVTGRILALQTSASALRLSICVIALATLGAISANVNPGRAGDLGEALRIYFLAAALLLMARWSIAAGPAQLLRPFLVGAAAGGLINIYYSTTEPYMIVGFMPTLRMTNGAGGFLGFTIWLGAWLALIGRSKSDAWVAIASSTVAVVAMVMSYSKTSMTMGACGLAAWGFVILQATAWRTTRVLKWAAAGAAVVAVAIALYPTQADLYRRSALLAVQNKFHKLDLRDKFSLGARYMYFWGVLEVVEEHPVFGVSYSGFYDAITRTAMYRTGQMADENREAGSRGESNPHSSILYYAAANGVPGLIVSMMLSCWFLALLYRSLSLSGPTGRGVWVCAAAVYLLYAATLPTLFNTKVLYLPAAVAVGQIVMVRRKRRRVPETVRAAPPSGAAIRTPALNLPAAPGEPAPL